MDSSRLSHLFVWTHFQAEKATDGSIWKVGTAFSCPASPYVSRLPSFSLQSYLVCLSPHLHLITKQKCYKDRPVHGYVCLARLPRTPPNSPLLKPALFSSPAINDIWCNTPSLYCICSNNCFPFVFVFYFSCFTLPWQSKRMT